MQPKIITFGEIMLRLATPNHQRFTQSKQFEVTYGGGEANVAVSLAQFGLNVSFVTKLPNNDIGQTAINHLRYYGVKTNCIVRGGDRTGIYFLETGAAMRPSKVIYDRANSAIAMSSLKDFDWEKIFKDATWLHATGITPALSKNCAEIIEFALKTAKEKGLTTSFDLNYRKKLWTPKEAQQVIKKLAHYVDVCIGNEEDIEKTLGYTPNTTDVTTAKLDIEGYKKIFAQIKNDFGFKYVTSTLRKSYSASDNGWSAIIYDGKEFYQSKEYEIRIVDRVGGGDSFAAGLIYSLINNKNLKQALEFAVAASALKHTIFGDFNIINLAEVENLLAGDVSGRVQR